MVNIDSIVLVKQNVFESNSAIARIIDYNSSTKEYTITDDREDFACSRNEFIVSFPHPGSYVRVVDDGRNMFPLDSIVEIVKISFYSDRPYKYVYLCHSSELNLSQYLFRKDFTLHTN